MKEKLTVIFDDECSLCTAGRNFASKFDRNKTIQFIGMNTERGKELIDRHHLDMNQSAYAFREDGSRAEKSYMVRDVLAQNGLVGFLLSLPFRIPYVSDKLYDFLAQIRWHTTGSRVPK